ncbi:hypothetical protein EJ110_NYTH28392 [Nymphaea thermarum]|nr:hypothetical protein EJ110_NYTH28392 [Nymphaea thermarum]
MAEDTVQFAMALCEAEKGQSRPVEEIVAGELNRAIQVPQVRTQKAALLVPPPIKFLAPLVVYKMAFQHLTGFLSLVLYLSTFQFSHAQLLFQAFNWESSKNSQGWYHVLKNSVPQIAEAGVTHVWLPPPSQSASPEGQPRLRVLILFNLFHAVSDR